MDLTVYECIDEEKDHIYRFYYLRIIHPTIQEIKQKMWYEN